MFIQSLLTGMKLVKMVRNHLVLQLNKLRLHKAVIYRCIVVTIKRSASVVLVLRMGTRMMNKNNQEQCVRVALLGHIFLSGIELKYDRTRTDG